MEAQVGIRLNMTKYTPVEWESIGLLSRIEQMYDINNSTDFDIAIGFGHLTGPEAFMMLLGMPMAFGMIDDTYRRFITLKTKIIKKTKLFKFVLWFYTFLVYEIIY